MWKNEQQLLRNRELAVLVSVWSADLPLFLRILVQILNKGKLCVNYLLLLVWQIKASSIIIQFQLNYVQVYEFTSKEI